MSGARPLWASSSAKNIRPARKIYAIWAYMPGEMGRISWGIYYVAYIFMDLRSVGHHGPALAIPPTPGGPISPDIAGFNSGNIGCGYSTPDHSRSAADPSPWSTPFEPQNEELQVHVSEYYWPRDLMKGHSSQGLDFRRQSGPGPRCALIWGLKTIPSSRRVSVV